MSVSFSCDHMLAISIFPPRKMICIELEMSLTFGNDLSPQRYLHKFPGDVILVSSGSLFVYRKPSLHQLTVQTFAMSNEMFV